MHSRGGSRSLLRVLTMLVVVLAMAALAAAQAARNSPDLVPTGKGWGVSDAHAPMRFAKGGGAKPGGSNNGIFYHGGPLMLGTPNVYFIWYGNWSGNSATTLLPTLINDLSGSGYEHINSTYYDGSNTHVSGLLGFATANQANDSYSRGTALSDSDIQAIVAAHCGSLGNCDANGIYFVLTSADVNETSGFCTQYCGWHTHGTISGKDVKYSFVGNPDRCPSACEWQNPGPNGSGGGDGMASIIAHESEEAISDPDLNAWYDRRGYENADKCAWTFGTTSTAPNGALYNFTGSSGTEWLIQRNWVNAGGGYCAMSY